MCFKKLRWIIIHSHYNVIINLKNFDKVVLKTNPVFSEPSGDLDRDLLPLEDREPWADLEPLFDREGDLESDLLDASDKDPERELLDSLRSRETDLLADRLTDRLKDLLSDRPF